MVSNNPNGARHEHVPEEEGGLHEAEHARALEVVEEAVREDEEARRAAREERAPPPGAALDGALGGGERIHPDGAERPRPEHLRRSRAVGVRAWVDGRGFRRAASGSGPERRGR